MVANNEHTEDTINAEGSVDVGDALNTTTANSPDSTGPEGTPDTQAGAGDTVGGDSRASNLVWLSEEGGQTREIDNGSEAPTRSTTTETLTRVTLGSALLALDTVSDRVEQAREIDQVPVPTPRTADSVLVPVSDWQEQFGESPDLAARYLALGMMIDAKSKAGRATRLLRGMSDLVANSVNAVLTPLGRSRTFTPIRSQFNTSLGRGESQVRQWMEMGRAEDERSRAVAQTAVGQIADEAMDEFVESERIEKFIQEMVAAQSVGIIDEAIEELRERTLSTDIFIERPFRRILRRPFREDLPQPDYDRQVIRPHRRRHTPLQPGSLLGYYAGFMSRLFAFALDIAFLSVFMAVSSWLISTVIGLLGLENAFASFRDASSFAEIAGTLFVSFYGVTVVIGYFVVFWVLTGQTLGMMILGLRVIAHDGDPLTVIQAILRLIGFSISASLLFLGFAWILIDDKREGWQDKIARSYVVYAWDANPDESFLFDYVSRRY